MVFRCFQSLSLAGVALCVSAALVSGDERTASLPSEAMVMAPLSLKVSGTAREPMGWTDFCKRYRGECDGKPSKPQDIVFDAVVGQKIARINSAVNAEITPATDREMWGAEERWDFPSEGRGDCEDYVLLKRARLMAEGFARESLLITVVTDLQGDGHAVLTLKTDRGDYILDNMNDEVKLWRETPYGFVKRQSELDQNVWVSLGSGLPGPITVAR
jgi:predicted transglutaminase-like cysteine proteinase